MLRICLTALIAIAGGVAGAQQPAAAPRYAAPPVPRAAARPQAPVLFRHANIDQAWKASQTSGRPMFLYVTSDNCMYCKKMLQETLAHPQITAGVAAYAEPAAFNASQLPELAQKLGVRAYPTTLVISPQNKLLGKIEGFVPPQELAKQFWPVLEQAEQARRTAINAAAAREKPNTQVGRATPPRSYPTTQSTGIQR
ncbi:thioredoxin family protein [Aeoliella sp. ICT_H6.2]|uniref:Thioredoxin family protein n=1 Tax=Aeoliella straminimaris TaxID=2954799 RepID=A0A9X2F6R2_9BACT|nr:thioredoxin family protein [Aeoliella straminimaris]MCO6043260.1 thioredoxin family protein [Aeoliella straminimaris]